MEFFDHLEDGLIDVEIGKDYAYQIKVSDANNNNRYLFVPIKGKEQKVAIPPEKLPERKEIEPNRDYLFMYDGAEVYIPKDAIYDSNRFVIGFDNNLLQIKADHVALRKAFKIKVIAPDSVVGHYLGVQLKNGKIGFISKTIRNNHFVAKIKKTGIRAQITRKRQKNRRITSKASDARSKASDARSKASVARRSSPRKQKALLQNHIGSGQNHLPAM